MNIPLAVAYAIYLTPLVGLTIFLYHRNHRPQPWTSATLGNFDETFLQYVATDGFWGGNPEIRILLSKMLAAFRNPSCRGVFICFQDPAPSSVRKFQMIQFDIVTEGSQGRGPVRFQGLPMIPIPKWGHATNQNVAMAFLGCRNKEQVEIITCSSEDIFRAVFEHLAATRRSRGEVDSTTGCKIYRGHLSPKKV